ncbi:MAG: ABC transporter substrate-binding protein [Elusimicrobia bacterium]|nr:ABC transporter substrate-binding protein [Elusimicrobiota bacterium]
MRPLLSLLLLWPAAARAAVKNPDTFTVAQIDEITSLDPAFPYDNASQNTIYNVYETLIAFDKDSLKSFVPKLSTRVPSVKNALISADGLVYRFPIRKGVKFSDGSPLTAEDARYSLLRYMLTDHAGGPSALLLEPIAGVPSTRDSSGTITLDFSVVDRAVRVEGDSVVVRLARPFAPFLSIMARWSYVESKVWAAAHGEWDGTGENWKKFNDPAKEKSYFYEHMNGTGPFALERWDKTGRYVLLSRNDSYWGKKPALRRVLIKTVPDPATRKLMLEAGDADLIDTPRPLVTTVRGLAGTRIVDGLPRLQTDPAFFFTFKINPAGNPDIGSGKLDGDGVPPDFFADADIRKGFSYAFDYDALLRDTFKGTAKRAIGPIPPGIPGYDPKQPHYDFDPKKAEEHLRKAWGGRAWEKGFRFTLTYNVGSENRQAAAQILKHGIEALNLKFKIDLRGVEWAAFLDKTQRRFMPLFSRGWSGDYPDGHNFVYSFYHSQGRYGTAQGYSNPELDRMIEGAVREVDPIKRAELYKRVLKLGYEDAPSIPMVHPVGVYAMRDWVRGFYDNPVLLGLDYSVLDKK